jgi:parvulin-like peptidyl-prolyl isomerase
VDKVSKDFQTDLGYHILKVNDKRPAPGDIVLPYNDL